MIHLEALVLVVALAGAWLAAWWASGADETIQPARVARLPLPRAQAAAFFGGLLALTAALNGPLHDLAERSLVSAHMIQHLLLVLVVAPCLLAGALPVLLDRVLAFRGVRAVVAVATRPLAALGLYAAVLIVWHLPGPYAIMTRSDLWHVVAHGSLVAVAVLAWWPALSPSRRLPALPYGARILYLFAFGMPMTVVAAMITGAEVVLYPTASPTPIEDQRLAGVLMWVPAGLVPLIAFTIVFFRWCAAEREEDLEYTK